MNLQQSIVREIENNGPISFARFMELALYAPELGYYEQQERVGRSGDFYTSVSVGNLFGELLATQFAVWLAEMNCSTLQLLEAGAHDGQLAFDILTALSRIAPHLKDRLRYTILEPSRKHHAWQQEKLRSFENVRWSDNWDQVEPLCGIIFSNELLDAMPCHRLCWNSASRRWQELTVDWNGGEFIWSKSLLENGLAGVPVVPDELAAVLPEGFETEISLAGSEWWTTAARKLKQGKLVAFDYGLTAEEFLMPERSRGTARAYHRHHLVENLLGNVGQQDLTFHVNFSALIAAGETAGLQTEFFNSQARFLGRILETMLKNGAPEWDRKQVAQFQTLTHPAHLGNKFKVLVQGSPSAKGG